jgi:hypothetical protein
MLEGRGGCTSRPTRADAVETMLLAGLPHHLERLDDWLAQQLAEGEAQREDRLAALTRIVGPSVPSAASTGAIRPCMRSCWPKAIDWPAWP